MIGTVLRIRYTIKQLLYENPICTAYLANDQIAGKDVCVKVFKQPFSGEKEFVDASFYHAQKVSSIHHPGLEKTLELDDHEGMPFLVCELPKGSVLRERIRRFAPFSVPVAVSIATAICEPLYALHKAGVVHGDISADNIVMAGDGAAMLLQAGQWQAYGHSRTAGVVALPGMAPYLAPEVSAGGMPTAESDVYAVGVMLYELLTGHAPYRADTPVALAMKHSTGTAPRVKALNSSVPMVLDEITHKALNRDPVQRYRSVGELLSDLRYLQDALRFGRSLSWPIRPESLSDRPKVAPRMSAVRTEEPKSVKPKPQPDFSEDEPTAGDVPIWMRIPAMVVAALIIFFVGWWIYTSFSTTKEVEVPRITNMPFNDAKKILEQSHLKGVIKARESHERLAADTVIAVSPAPGEKVKENGSVYITLSTGSQFVDVPSLMGMTVDEARSVLKQMRLELYEPVQEKRSRSAEKGTVIGQNPDARAKIEQGSKVRIVISSGKDAPNNDRNDEILTSYDIEVNLTGIENPVLLRVDMIDDKGTQTVLEEEHNPGEKVTISADGYGREVIFKIFYDGEAVKQVTMKSSEGTQKRGQEEGDNR